MKFAALVLLLALSASAQTPPPPEMGLDSFYEKYLDAGGLPIVGSRRVDDRAFLVARDVLGHMMAKRPDVLRAMVERGAKLGILGADEITTDLPGHRDLYDVFPGTDWDVRTRGVGGTIDRPLASVGEENLLGIGEDRYIGECILVHEFGHSVLNLGVDDATRERLRAAYAAAKEAGLWEATYAATDADEYWAEGIQDWFDANLEADPADGVHNRVNTRAELREHDPALAGILAEVFPDDDWRRTLPARAPTIARDTGIDLRILNASSASVSVQWIDFEGNLVPMADLDPGEECDVTTYAGHAWVATAGGRRRRAYVVPPCRESTWTILWPGE